jgi:hypothetical protein
MRCCAAEVAWFPGFVQRAEGVGNALGELRAGGRVDHRAEGSSLTLTIGVDRGPG